MKLTKQDEILIRDLEEFADDSDVNESGIYTKILDFIRRLQYDCSSASKASDEWKAKYEAERNENAEQKTEIERLTEETKTAWQKFKQKVDESIELSMLLDKRVGERAELQKQVDAQKTEIERLKKEKESWKDREKSFVNAVEKLTKEKSELKADIKRLTGELDKATGSLVTASRCFTRMETFYKDKCTEFETAQEKDAADSKQHCEKCRTYWLSKLDAQKEKTAKLQTQVNELKEQKEFWEAKHNELSLKLEEYDDKSEEYENALVMKQYRITELQKQVDELKKIGTRVISRKIPTRCDCCHFCLQRDNKDGTATIDWVCLANDATRMPMATLHYTDTMHWRHDKCPLISVETVRQQIYEEIDTGDILVVQTQEYGEIEVVPIERLKEIINRKVEG